jgi:hypothetical protein
MVINRLKSCLLAIVLLYGFGYTDAFAGPYGRNAQSDSWAYQPKNGSITTSGSLSSGYLSRAKTTSTNGYTMYGNTPVYGSNGASDNKANYSPSVPTYNFYTTSPIISSIGRTNPDLMNLNEKIRYTSPWDWNEDDDPVGEVGDPLPVGDTPWLLMALFAAGYIAFRYLRQRKTAKA